MSQALMDRIVTAIEELDEKNCETGETDSGETWDLMYWIRDEIVAEFNTEGRE